MSLQIDHLIWGVPELEAGVGQIADLLGLRPVPGGRHPGYGTHNALLGLGADRYLEILAPDPTQPDATRPLWMGLDELTEPRLIYWAARSPDLPGLIEKARKAGIDPGEVFDGSRQIPDGRTLRWRLTDPRRRLADGIIPFFIDWGNTPHPATGLPQGCRLLSLTASHPSSSTVQSQLDQLGIDLKINPGPASLQAVLDTPRGAVTLS